MSDEAFIERKVDLALGILLITAPLSIAVARNAGATTLQEPGAAAVLTVMALGGALAFLGTSESRERLTRGAPTQLRAGRALTAALLIAGIVMLTAGSEALGILCVSIAAAETWLRRAT